MLEHFDKNNLHHAYLIEGESAIVVPEILDFIKSLGIKKGSPDLYYTELDSFKIEDARKIKSYSVEKGFSSEKNAKKIFIISANSFLLEAQNSLLKLFEEPIENTHFFVTVPDINALLPTLVSRFYVISGGNKEGKSKDAEKFIAMNLPQRINFIKELLAEEESEELAAIDSNRAKSLKFLNSLEFVLHNKMSKTVFDTIFFEHLFKVREFLRMPGSSTKMLMESVALVIPNL